MGNPASNLCVVNRHLTSSSLTNVSMRIHVLTHWIKLAHCLGSHTSAHQNDTAALSSTSRHDTQVALAHDIYCACALTQLNGCSNCRWKDSAHFKATHREIPTRVKQVCEPCLSLKSPVKAPIHAQIGSCSLHACQKGANEEGIPETVHPQSKLPFAKCCQHLFLVLQTHTSGYAQVVWKH